MIACKNKPTKPVKTKPVKTVTDFGTWEKLDWESGQRFGRFTSHNEVLDLPLLSIAWGVDPDTHRMATAHGFVAIGQRAKGTIAIGQFVNGYISIGQFATGRIAAVGQFVAAPLAIGQFALGLAAVGQFGAAGWGIFQMGAVAFGGVGALLYKLIF